MEFNVQPAVIVGNKGKGVRSDCSVQLELTKSGGIQIELSSKVEVMYGNSIRKMVQDILKFFDIIHAHIVIEDSGALSWVIAARTEAAVKTILSSDKEYLLPMLPENLYSTAKDKNRVSRLYLPGNTPSLMINAGIHKPDGIILDLEDAVAPSKKPEARFLVRNALRGIDFYGAERMVRINQVPAGLEDLEYVVPHNVNLLLVPKCEGVSQLGLVNQKVKEIRDKHGILNPVWLMPIIESAAGVLNCPEIARGENVVAMAIGLEDYSADLGVKRTREGKESFFARSMIVNACKAAGIQAIDSVFSDVSDMDALKTTVEQSKALGFDGMGCIHPRQIPMLHDGFSPDMDEIEKAKKIINAFMDAEEKGLGVVSLGTKMIDAPVVKQAQNIIDKAVTLKKINADWRTEFLSQMR